ncbi:MAG: hypothetical protein ACRCZO_17210 [Cetobacterium sp.]
MERKIDFHDLAPVDDLDLGSYKDALDFSLKNKKIKNIAISGGYGSGKSSLLETYKKNSEKKFIHISLARFKDFDNKEKKEILLNSLEAKILNQLIHQINPEDIFQTNFKIKRKITVKDILIPTVLFLSFILLTINFIYSEKWKKFIIELYWPYKYLKLDKLFQITTTGDFKLAVGIILFVILGKFIYEILKFQKIKGCFKKLNIQGNEIDIAEDNEDSYFDKYLNEVLYLFQESNVDAIVFEDIDRYEIGEIFERLREINNLVNNRLKKDGKVLKFFYLLKDDIFISKDRTKFFDFIIPVIPVMDSSNSYEKILDLFNIKEEDKLDKYFLQDISLYIDDLRLLKNIYNEYQIYYKKLNSIEINCNKMLGIIIYKNLFPRDFSNLQLKQGFIYNLFNSKEKIKFDEIKNIDEKLVELKNKLEEIKFEFLTKEELNCVKEYKTIKIREYYYANKKEAENWIKFEYPKRIALLEQREKFEVDKLQNKILDLEKQKNKVLNRNLKEIITRENIDEIFEINEFKEVTENKYFKLLKYLVRNGYLDETHSDYMTYFYGKNLSKEDKIFLRSISDKEKKEYGYKLKNPNLVLESLSDRSFDEIEVLNFDLLKILLNKEEKRLTSFLLLVKENKNFEFIREFFNLNINIEKFIEKLNSVWSENIKFILEDNLFSEAEKHRYSLISLYTSNDELLTRINSESILKKYIENKESYLQIDNPKKLKILSAFEKLEIKFKSINYEVSDEDLFKEIYLNSMYELNFNNITLMLKKIFGITLEEKIRTKNYTIICTDKESALYKYVNTNIGVYIEELLANTDLIEDEEQVVIEILNNEDISIYNREEYIRILNTIVFNISGVNEELWDKLIVKEKVEYSEDNIITYFQKKKELNEQLINFINLEKKKLLFEKYPEEISEKLFDAILICNDIKDTIYKESIESLGYYYEEGGIPLNIQKSKFDIIIELGTVRMTAKNLKEIRENYIDNLDYYIKSNIDEYIKIMEDELYSEGELNTILCDNEVDEKLKLELLKFSKEIISIKNPSYSLNVLKYILENNFDQSELIYLVINYEKYEETIKNKIFELVEKKLPQLSSDIKLFPEELIKKILQDGQIVNENKIEFLKKITDVKILKKYFRFMKLPKYNKIFNKNSEIKLEKSDFNFRLLNKLQEDNLIETFNENEEGQYIVKTKM